MTVYQFLVFYEPLGTVHSSSSISLRVIDRMPLFQYENVQHADLYILILKECTGLYAVCCPREEKDSYSLPVESGPSITVLLSGGTAHIFSTDEGKSWNI